VKRTSLILLIGIAAPVFQGVLNTFVPARFAPDLGFLVVIALGLHWRSTAGGLVLAATLGFAADLLSGSLLGQQALLLDERGRIGGAAVGALHRHLQLASTANAGLAPEVLGDVAHDAGQPRRTDVPGRRRALQGFETGFLGDVVRELSIIDEAPGKCPDPVRTLAQELDRGQGDRHRPRRGQPAGF